jgi:hypothetical protein
VKKSQAIMPLACARKNAREVSDERRGAGSMSAFCRIVQTVLAARRTPSPASSPAIRGSRYLKGAGVVKDGVVDGSVGGCAWCVRLSMRVAARPYLGEREGNAGGRIGVVAVAHSSVGNAKRARGYEELTASFVRSMGPYLSHRCGAFVSSGWLLFEFVQDVVGAAHDLARDSQDRGLGRLAPRLDASVQNAVGASRVAGLMGSLHQRPPQLG